MIKHNQVGSINPLLFPLIACSVLLLGALGFAGWAYMGRQDYKENVDQKVAVAVEIATERESSRKDKQFVEDEKKPFKTYVGPEPYGSLAVQYPKTWSGYVDTTGANAALIDGYFYPGVVPSVTGLSSVFALRIQVLNQTYVQTITPFTSLQKEGKLKIEPYALPRVPKQIGIKAIGLFPSGKSGTAVYVPLRDKTLVIGTDGQEFLKDYNDSILANLVFAP